MLKKAALTSQVAVDTAVVAAMKLQVVAYTELATEVDMEVATVVVMYSALGS